MIKRLGALRDGLLVCSSIVYILGYATWSIYAWRAHLGPVTALDAQYFGAGLPIALGLFCTFGSVFLLRHVVDVRWRNFVAQREARSRQRLESGIFAALFVLAVVTVVLLVRSLGGKVSPNRLLSLCAILVVDYIGIAFYGRMSEKPDRFARFAPSIVLGLVGCLGVGYFAVELYPTIPASLAGGRPRLVVLDVQTSGLAPETLRLLSPGASIPAGVMRTRELTLVTGPGQYYLVSIPLILKDSSSLQLQLSESSVLAVIWKN